MSKVGGFRPKLLPPQGRLLERSYRPCRTCLVVSSCITLLISVVFGLTAYNIYIHRFQSNEHHFHAGDQLSLRQATSDLSPVFCSAYTVWPQKSADFYLLPKKAELDPFKHVNFTFSMKAGPDRTVFVTRTYYLPPGSEVSVSGCYDVDLNIERHRFDITSEFLVIVGNADFNEWRKYFSNRRVRHRIPIPKKATCQNDSSALPHLVMTAKEANNYYFVLLMHSDFHFTAGGVTVTGNVSRTRYNVSGAVDMCRANQTSCQFSLDWGSTKDIIAQVLKTGVKSFPDSPASFLTDCEERLAFWIPIFGVLPFCLIAFCSFWCWWLLVKKRNIRSHYRLPESGQSSGNRYGSVSETAPLVSESSHTTETMSSEGDGCASIQD